MGFLDIFRNREGSEKRDIPQLADGGLQQIVGESFYGDAFSTLARLLRKASGTEAEVDIVLRLDPSNPHSKSGKAVAVFVLGHKVGHIPETHCVQLFDLISQRGSEAGCSGRIFFDDFKRDRPSHSVSLYLDFPPRFPDQADRSVAFSKLDGAKQDELELKREARIAGNGPELPELNSGDEINSEDIRGFELKVFEKMLEPHGISVGRSSSAALHVIVSPDSWNSRVGLERLLKKDIPSVYLSDFLAKYPQFKPNLELEEAIDAARNWIRLNPDSSSVEKSVVENAVRLGRLVLRGHAVVEGNPVDGGVSSFALYAGRVMAEHRGNIEALMVSSGARLYDKLLVLGDLRKVEEKSRYYISVDGVDVCAMYAEQRDYFDLVGSAKRQDLVEISWIDKETFGVKVFSFYFHYQ